MANLVKRYAEPAPVEPRNHAEFEQFIRDLDAGRLSRKTNDPQPREYRDASANAGNSD